MANELMSMNESMSNNGIYCSFAPKTEEEKRSLYNATSNVDHGLRECINMEINLKDIYIEAATMNKVDDATGEITTVTAPRIILFDDAGVSYGCCSMGIFHSLERMVSLFGAPATWEKPIKVMPIMITRGKKQIMHIKLV